MIIGETITGVINPGYEFATVAEVRSDSYDYHVSIEGLADEYMKNVFFPNYNDYGATLSWSYPPTRGAYRPMSSVSHRVFMTMNYYRNKKDASGNHAGITPEIKRVKMIGKRRHSANYNGILFEVNIPVEGSDKDHLLIVCATTELAVDLFGGTINKDGDLYFPAFDSTIVLEKPHTFNFNHRTISTLKDQTFLPERLFKQYFDIVVKNTKLSDIPRPEKTPGISKSYANVEPYFERLKVEDPIGLTNILSLVDVSGKTVEKVKVSTVFNAMFAEVKTYEELQAQLATLGQVRLNSWSRRTEDCVTQMFGDDHPIFRSQLKKAIMSTSNRAFSLVLKEAESLDFDRDKYPILAKAIDNGDIPIGVFFRKSKQYFIFNDRWDLWEEMLKNHKAEVMEIAKDASSRSTYEKDLMSYFYFVIHGLPDYLKKHTGKKWKCVPKFVKSANELEPPKEDENGVARKRSALTPVVDQEKRIVTVPYVAMSIAGATTTYTYAHDYHVLREGFSFLGNVVIDEVEKKLNGRDDYGLMFYTLTGSPVGRGYPTFLIIFERRGQAKDTRVHFHRVHPSRSKDGDANAIHNWIRTGYGWMAGNVNKELIVAQQGDLSFVNLPPKMEDGEQFENLVDECDHHCFAHSVPFRPSTRKDDKDLLGWVDLKEETILSHNEHDDVLIPAGIYMIRQARSWEANPKGIWTLRID
jgi:hypothetical protein